MPSVSVHFSISMPPKLPRVSRAEPSEKYTDTASGSSSIDPTVVLTTTASGCSATFFAFLSATVTLAVTLPFSSTPTFWPSSSSSAITAAALKPTTWPVA